MSLTYSILWILCSVAVGGSNPPLRCGRNEERTDCLTPCQPTCSKPYIICYFLVCNPGCQCKSGYIRATSDGRCVPKTRCGAYCMQFQKYTSCGSPSPPNCSNRNRTCDRPCLQGCYCRKGYILDDSQSKCILKRDCPQSDDFWLL